MAKTFVFTMGVVVGMCIILSGLGFVQKDGWPITIIGCLGAVTCSFFTVISSKNQ